MKKEDYVVHENAGKGPAWKRCVVSDKNGVVYLPVTERFALREALFLGLPLLQMEKGTFMRTSDILKVYPPDCEEVVKNLENKFRGAWAAYMN